MRRSPNVAPPCPLTAHAQQVEWRAENSAIITATGRVLGAMCSHELARIVVAIHNNGLDDAARLDGAA